ncbi:MAG: DUF3226 domain-containing protein [Coleofasciculus sp. C1-SOL-03]|uniref:DUF3226 domain-containing protein n=1 Tax=Coleofasciculus sp. C1-SOL-03 TaxID=3069522 RepID=UPI0033054DBA
MASKYYPKKLIVEGDQDRRVIPELIEANGIPWLKREIGEKVPYIESFGSDDFIDADIISTELKASGLTTLGLIVDADNDLYARWTSIRNACLKSMPDFPEQLPKTGLIHSANGIKFGVWIMPDNQKRGMLETFLAYMIPDESEPLWQYAQDVVTEAKRRGAPFKDAHLDQANIYTWLAWQNSPGRQLHNAIIERIWNLQHPQAQPFMTWFKNLYNL